MYDKTKTDSLQGRHKQTHARLAFARLARCTRRNLSLQRGQAFPREEDARWLAQLLGNRSNRDSDQSDKQPGQCGDHGCCNAEIGCSLKRLHLHRRVSKKMRNDKESMYMRRVFCIAYHKLIDRHYANMNTVLDNYRYPLFFF